MTNKIILPLCLLLFPGLALAEPGLSGLAFESLLAQAGSPAKPLPQPKREEVGSNIPQDKADQAQARILINKLKLWNKILTGHLNEVGRGDTAIGYKLKTEEFSVTIGLYELPYYTLVRDALPWLPQRNVLTGRIKFNPKQQEFREQFEEIRREFKSTLLEARGFIKAHPACVQEKEILADIEKWLGRALFLEENARYISDGRPIIDL